MLTIRQSRLISIILSAIFTLTLLLFTSAVYIDNYPQLFGYPSIALLKAKPHKENDTRLHAVRSGETLADISKKYYGSPNYIETLFEANRLLITSSEPEPGTHLSIPTFP